MVHSGVISPELDDAQGHFRRGAHGETERAQRGSAFGILASLKGERSQCSLVARRKGSFCGTAPADRGQDRIARLVLLEIGPRGRDEIRLVRPLPGRGDGHRLHLDCLPADSSHVLLFDDRAESENHRIPPLDEVRFVGRKIQREDVTCRGGGDIERSGAEQKTDFVEHLESTH